MSHTPARKEWLAQHGRPMECPYCGSADTERSALFGPFHMSEAYVCLECKSPFSRIRWEEEHRDVPTG